MRKASLIQHKKKTFLLNVRISKAEDILIPKIVQEDSRQCCRWRTGGVVIIIMMTLILEGVKKILVKFRKKP